jgi:hypothetical protein
MATTAVMVAIAVMAVMAVMAAMARPWDCGLCRRIA